MVNKVGDLGKGKTEDLQQGAATLILTLWFPKILLGCTIPIHCNKPIFYPVLVGNGELYLITFQVWKEKEKLGFPEDLIETQTDGLETHCCPS